MRKKSKTELKIEFAFEIIKMEKIEKIKITEEDYELIEADFIEDDKLFRNNFSEMVQMKILMIR